MNKRIQKLLISVVIGLLIVLLAVSVFVSQKKNGDYKTMFDENVKSHLTSTSIAAHEFLTILIIMLTAVMGFNVILIRRFVVKPISWLTDSISSIIDKDSIYGEDRNDEIGELARVILKTNREMESTLEKARAASKAKSDFLANMSHEIRTPINAIIGMTNIAESAHNIERKDYALEKIKDASSHLLGVINNILDMSKIEANKLELNSVAFNFEEMLQKVTNIINFRIAEKHQKLSVHIDENIPRTLICDDQRLAQAVANLLSNAVKFTPEQGAIYLSAHLLKVERGVCEIKFDIKDTGLGISEEQQARLFNPFEQAESSTTRKYGGTGLGLAITKRIVELMGGNISISSTCGEGSTFSFTIRAEKGDQEKENTLPQMKKINSNSIQVPVNEEHGTTEHFYGYRALLAEDVDINREIVLTLLEPTLLEIDCAENGVEAVRMYSKDPGKYNIIFMDLQMPEMDGYEATRKIRALDEKSAKTIPIIAMTANVFKEDIDNCLKAGMNGHLGKPFDLDAVMQTLKRYLFQQMPVVETS